MADPSTSVSDSPFQGLVPFSEADEPYFHGRDDEIRLLSAHFVTSRHTVLFGPSGAGKSSLLRAGVMPRVDREESRAPFIFDDWRSGDPSRAIIDALGAWISARSGELISNSAEQPLDDYLAACSFVLGRPITIVLDQFEEYFVNVRQAEHATAFEESIARLVNSDVLPVNTVFSLRDDSLWRLERFDRRIPNLLGNTLRVRHLDEEGVRQAIEKPLEVFNSQHTEAEHVIAGEGFVEAVVRELSKDCASRSGDWTVSRPPEVLEAYGTAPALQLILDRVWRHTQKEGLRELRSKSVDDLDGKCKIVNSYVEEQIKKAKVGRIDKGSAAKILDYLASDFRFKQASDAETLQRITNVNELTVEHILGKLADENVRILKRVPGTTPDRARFEVYHDVLIPGVAHWSLQTLRGPGAALQIAMVIVGALLLSVFASHAKICDPELQTAVRILTAGLLNVLAAFGAYTFFSRLSNVLLRHRYSMVVGGLVWRIGMALPPGLLLTLFWIIGLRIEVAGQVDSQAPAIGTFVPVVRALPLIANVSPLDMLVFLLVTATLGFMSSLLMYSLMPAGGIIARKLGRSYERGFYGAYALIIIATALMIFGQLQPCLDQGQCPGFMSFRPSMSSEQDSWITRDPCPGLYVPSYEP